MDAPTDCSPTTRIEATVGPKLSLAFHQNAVPILRELVILNDGDASLEGLQLELASEPPFVRPKVWRVDQVGPRQRYHISDLDLALDGALLGRLTEAEATRAVFVLRQGEREIARLERPVELLARNQWGGLQHVPELIAAFVQPNDPAVDRLLKKAAEILRRHGKDPALDGYKTAKRQRAWELASALWSAVGALGLDYALPPASFELQGQKVRSPTQVLEGGVATCLDLALLFAAGLEQCGLHPVLVFTRGHAFVGAWLADEDFASAVVDDVTALRKRVALKELVLFEATLATHRPAPTFARACERGAQQVGEAEEDRFELAVDVRRARMQRIRPLASSEAAAGASAPELSAEEPPFEDAPSLPEEETRPAAAVAEGPQGRLERWQRKLLDLSLRNNLLNFPTGKRAVVLDAPEPGQVEDALARGRELKFQPRPDVMEGADPRSAVIHQARHDEDARRAHALEALGRDTVLVRLAQDDLDGRLVELYRGSRASLQEGGANTLFLAFGFLAWTRDDRKGRSFRAPLILIPVALHRQSVRSGFRLALHEDEARFNPTLLEMLRQDFGLAVAGLGDELPKDEAGLDVAGIWRTVARAVKDVPGWEVKEDVVLATFSFAKYLMWKDLVDRTAELKQNPVVRHLIDTPREAYRGAVAFPSPRELDATHEPARTFCPLPADSSQLAAVMAAARGKDFVLEGPPGTGKSQTIANLIAQCLAEGKTVLFVSEKMAALDVVHRRLRQVGLGEFCLELHSSKTRKLEVLQQLQRAWGSRGSADLGEWAREAERLKRLRHELNRFVEHLHRKRRNGLSAYEAIGRVVAGRGLPTITLAWPSADAHDADALDQLREIADRLDLHATEVGGIKASPLAMVATTAWSPGWQAALVAAAAELAPACRELEGATQGFIQTAGLPPAGLAASERRDALAALAALLPEAAGRDRRFLLQPDARLVLERFGEGLAKVRARQDRLSRLSMRYRPEALWLDLDDLRATWDQAQKAWWPRKPTLEKRVRAALAAVTDSGRSEAIACGPDIDGLIAIRALEHDIEGYADLRARTGGLWAGTATREDEAQRTIGFHRQLGDALGGLAGTAEDLRDLRSAIARLLGDGNALLEPGGAVALAGARYRDALARFREASKAVAALAGADPGAAYPSLTGLADACGKLADQAPKLRAWCAWRKVRAEAAAAGLAPLTQAVEAGAVAAGKGREAFEVAYARWWITALVDGDDVLRDFVPAEHERRIEEFRRLDERFTELTKAYIRAALCAELPGPETAGRSAEWGLLRRETERKRGHLPLRQLIGSLPTALTKLTPCLLMSPLSVAQYLPAGTAPFDVVVFDEASQIPVWDGVGAMARGKQAVIVGDPKQLPPTSFFARAEEDQPDEDVAAEGDLESILDECLGAGLPRLGLSWHYRSRHESLIAFSNGRYYQGRLVTFPSTVTDDRAVSLRAVADGLYDKGGARTNKPEARTLVADLVGRLRDPAFVARGHTIGVVTFNAEQQRLIEDLLDEERRKDPSIEPHFAEDRLEPVFVKNLESVQGDERDLMYFSTTYGPDRSGHVSMNFGPMNRDGGERRLNVAVTRARHELRVFSSLRPERIDLSRTQALGVRDLKHFLEFAERGPRALGEAVSGSIGGFESPFEEAVAQRLADRGWRVHPQVGVSAFRIDLGVVDPDAPGRFLAGIECDGATYHRSATARDRDKLREQVLRGLGWQIVRIWSTDWWIDAAGALEKVEGRLRAILEASRATAATTPELDGAVPAEEAAPAEDARANAALDGLAAAAALTSAADAVQAAASAEEPSTAPILPVPEQELAVYARRDPPPATGGGGRYGYGEFREADLASLALVIEPEAFTMASYGPTLRAMMRHVVEVEGPVRDDVLVRRLARAHGFARASARIRERVLELARPEFATTAEGSAVFFWPVGSDAGMCSVFRRANGGEPRPVDEIALPELVALAGAVRGQGHEGEDAIRVMLRELGLQNLRTGTRARLEKAWQLGEQR